MNPSQPKKMLVIDILEVLRRHSDADHRLSQREIAELLERDFGMKADRKAVKRNLANLIDEGYPIAYTVTSRRSPDPTTGKMEDNDILTDFYYEHEFTDAELRLLIDGLAFSRHISLSQRKELVAKLEGLSSRYFEARMSHVRCMTKDKTDNAQLFLNIELLDEAISKKRKVEFKYLTFGTDKKAHPRTRNDGTERIYLVSPYQMAAKEDKYYLICNYDKYGDISNYRLDRIVDLRITDERAKPFSSLRDSDGGKFDLASYLREHVYMYSSSNVTCTFRIMKRMVADIMDMFGSDIQLFNETAETIEVTAKVNELSMKEFAKRYAPDVVVLKPKELANRVRDELCAALAAYEGGTVV